MKISKIIIILFSCFFIAAVFYQFKFAKTVKDTNVLVVGTSLDYPPYEYIDTETGQPAGLDIDIVNEIARLLKKKLVLKDMPFSALIFGLLTDDIDMIAAGISPTERRARLVSFSNSYLQGQPFVLITKTAQLQPCSMQDLQGKVIAVNTGYITDLYMSKEHPNIELVKLDSPADCFLALQTGTVDAFLTSQNSATLFLEHVANAKDFSVMNISDTGEICALAVAKNNIKLLEEINQALALMWAQGSLEKIKQKWKFL